jgi:ParB/RepB/Spo0J family partition protein
MATAEAPTKNVPMLTGFEDAKFDFRPIPVKDIRIPENKLRDVDRNSHEYILFRDSIASTDGPMESILVRPLDEKGDKGQELFGLIDGLQRLSACQDLDIELIGARVVDPEEADIAIAQILANHSRIQTSPVQYTNQLYRILLQNPHMTKEELADRLSASTKWLNDRLSLLKIEKSLQPLVDQGKIRLAHAFLLAKLPDKEQLEFAEAAQTEGIQEFAGHVDARVKELRKAARQGRDAAPTEWVPVPHMRKIGDVKAELKSPVAMKEVLAATGAKTPEEVWMACVNWVMCIDPITAEKLKKEHDLRTKAKAEEKLAKEQEKQRKSADRARQIAQQAGIKVEAGSNGATEEDEDEDEDEDL